VSVIIRSARQRGGEGTVNNASVEPPLATLNPRLGVGSMETDLEEELQLNACERCERNEALGRVVEFG
jgi:hypothetical protein